VETQSIENILGASHWLHCGASKGNAIAVTERKCLSALHGKISEGTAVQLVDIHGNILCGKVIKSVFEVKRYDLALIELDDGQSNFAVYIPIHRSPVKLGQKIKFVGLAVGLNDDSMTYAESAEVNAIEPESALLRSAYYGIEGFSGAGIVVIDEGNGQYQLVGVHSSAHDDTVKPPALKKIKKSNSATAKSISDMGSSLSSSLHGHIAYCLICEVARVNEIQILL